MSKLSLFDKIGILFETTLSSNLHIIAILLLIVLGLILLTTTKKNEQRNKIIYIAYTIFVLVFVVVSYHASLGNMFSYMMNNFFIAIYFPNLAIYLAAIIITNIILFISIFNYKTPTYIRNLNVVIYTIMNYLLLTVLSVVNRNQLDIFNTQSVYGNKEATALIELSSLIFMLWIIFLIIYKIILIYLKKEYRPKVKKVIIRKKIKKLPENYQPLDIPDYVYGNIPHQGTISIKPSSNDKLLKEFENKFTLEEYKLFSKILKEQKQKESTELEKIKEEVRNELSNIDIVQEELKEYTIIPETSIEESKEDEYINEIIKEETSIEDTRDREKQEIIKMEEERRELLRLAQEKKAEEEVQKNTMNILPIDYKSQYDYEIEEKEQAKLTELERLYQSIR